MDSIPSPLNPSPPRSRRLTITNMQPQPKNAQQLPPHALAFIFAVSWFIYSLLFQGLITLAPAVKGRYITDAAAHRRGDVSLNEEDISKAKSTRQPRARVVQAPAPTSRLPASKKHVSFHNIAPIDVESARAGSPSRERADSPVNARPRFSLNRPLLRRLSVVPEVDGDESDSGKRTVMFSVSSPTATMSSVFSKCDKTERRKSENAAGRELFVQATSSSAGSTRTSTCSDASTCTSISSEPVSPDSERSSFSFAPCKSSSASLMKRVNHKLTSPWKVTKTALHDVPSAHVSPLRTRPQTANKSGVSRPSSFTPAILASLGMSPKRTIERTDPYAAPYNAPLPRYKHSSLGSASRSRSGTPARARSFSVDAGQLRERLSALQL